MADDNWNKTHLIAALRRPPLSPSDEDLAFVAAMIAPALANAGPRPRALVLGMTPGLVQRDWPPGAEIVAVDSSPGIIASAWTPHASCASRAVCAPWQQMPFCDAAIDVAVGDGSLNSLPSLNHYQPTFREIARVLKPSGSLVLRCFLRPAAAETPEHVVALARDGQFPTTTAFRLRFAMALTEPSGSVGLAALWEAFQALVPDRDELARAAGWPRADIDRIDVDRDSKVRFTFPTQSQLASLAEPEFTIERMERGTYTQAEHCPTLLFRSR